MLTKNASSILRKIAAACPTCGKEGYGAPTNSPMDQKQPYNQGQPPVQNSGRPQWFEDWLKTQKPTPTNNPDYYRDPNFPQKELEIPYYDHGMPTIGTDAPDARKIYLPGEREWLRDNWNRAIVNPYRRGRSNRPLFDLQY